MNIFNMDILKRIGIALGVIVLLFIIVGLLLPSKRHLERSIMVNTPASVVFQEVNSFKRWEHWSPWRHIDPTAIMKYTGPEAGVGCTMSWASDNPKAGKGMQKIVVSEPDQRIVTKLVFKDWDGSLSASWKFEEQEGTSMTKVTWNNESDNKGNILYKYMDLFIYPKLGKDYEQGLKNLKEHAEALYAKELLEKEGQIEEVEPGEEE